MAKKERLNKIEGREWAYILIIFSIIFLGYLAQYKANNKFVDSIYIEIKKNNIAHPEIVIKQSIWETGWFKCKKCSWRYNNAFGFRYKDWVTKDNPKGYIVFKTWQESVAYYARWQKRHYKEGDYYKFLEDRGYASDKNYIANIKSIKYE
tara:strand:- start:586 stop:1035 length:450 start_codon:yes stop_codon:yes gene_type:complete